MGRGTTTIFEFYAITVFLDKSRCFKVSRAANPIDLSLDLSIFDYLGNSTDIPIGIFHDLYDLHFFFFNLKFHFFLKRSFVSNPGWSLLFFYGFCLPNKILKKEFTDFLRILFSSWKVIRYSWRKSVYWFFSLTIICSFFRFSVRSSESQLKSFSRVLTIRPLYDNFYVQTLFWYQVQYGDFNSLTVNSGRSKGGRLDSWVVSTPLI